MDEKKKSLKDNVEDTMACTAYAEAGEPCPIDTETKQKKTSTVLSKDKSGKKSSVQSVQDTMACTAYAEAGEPCPIDTDKK